MPESPQGYERLTCSCGTDRFARIMHLRWKPGSGVTEEPGGYFCVECHGVVDAAALIQKAQVRIKQRELKELQEEVGLPRTEEQAHATERRPVSSGAKGRG